MTLKLAGRHQISSRPATTEDRKSDSRSAKKPQHHHRREITNFQAGDLTSRLGTEAAIAQEVAIASRLYRVLVTRHAHDLYTVEVAPEVPYGLTMEKDPAPYAINRQHP